MTDDFSKLSIGEYLQALASSEPAPGGGSAVAITGALAASLAQMVCRLSIGRADDADYDGELRAALERADGLGARLLVLATEDAAAYTAYVTAAGLPRTSPEEKTERRAMMQLALRTAADVPSDIAAVCLRLAEELEPIARLGSTHMLSDVEVAVYLAEAAACGAFANVRVNARLMRDRELANDFVDGAARLKAEISSAAAAVLAVVRHRSGPE